MSFLWICGTASQLTVHQNGQNPYRQQMAPVFVRWALEAAVSRAG
ncbi:MAG: hypothetical protein WAS33_27600 [Candidatus Promineifilaceae bacterium]